jgi:tungstate transport system ATP-binding protein
MQRVFTTEGYFAMHAQRRLDPDGLRDKQIHRRLVLQSVNLVRHGKRLLHSVELCLPLQSRTVLIGANGAGKTSLLQVIHGLLKPESGSIRIESAPDSDQARLDVGSSGASAVAGAAMGSSPVPGAAMGGGAVEPAVYAPDFALVFQRPVMLRRTVIGNLEHALAIRGVDRRYRERLALQALERVGLAALADRPARRLSGGEQQRVAIARADVLSPGYLLLDEPCAGLDPASTLAIERYLLQRAGLGQGFLMSTHDLAQARRLAEWVVFVQQGVVLECTPAHAFFAAPSTEQGRRFLTGDLET